MCSDTIEIVLPCSSLQKKAVVIRHLYTEDSADVPEGTGSSAEVSEECEDSEQTSDIMTSKEQASVVVIPDEQASDIKTELKVRAEDLFGRFLQYLIISVFKSWNISELLNYDICVIT